MFCAFCNENLGPAEPGTLNNKIAVNAIALQVKIQDRDIKIARLNNRIAELEAEIESHHKELDLAAKHERDNYREALESIRDRWTELDHVKHSNAAYIIAEVALDPEGCADLARIPKP